MAFQGHVGGGILNTAVACARLGPPTGLITQLSTDLFGEQLLRHLQANGVDTRHVTRSAAPSTLAFVQRTATTNRYAFYMNGTADQLWSPPELPALPDSCRILAFGSIALLQPPAGVRITELVEAHRGRRLVVFDPNIRPSLIADMADYRRRFERWLGSTDLLKLSDEDAEALAPGVPADAAVQGWLALGPKAIVLTRGAQGATLYRAGSGPQRVTAPSVRVADTIGAGDTFTAGLCTGLLEQGVEQAAQLAELPSAAWDQVLALAAAAAALNCTREGCDPPTRAQVAAALA